MFISLGFLVSAPPEVFSQLEKIVHNHSMSAVIIGFVDDSSSLRLKKGNEEATLFDFSQGPVLTPR